MNEAISDKPDALLEMGGCIFQVWVCKKGISKIQLPEPDCRDVIDPREARLNLRNEVPSRADGFEIRCLESLRDYLESVFKGNEPSGAPAYSLDGLSPFTMEVLRSTARIPWGSTRSYSWVASDIGRDRAARAVGTALGSNPLPIVIPCHRVIRSNGDLGGYSCGLLWKERLISIESNRRRNDSGRVQVKELS